MSNPRAARGGCYVLDEHSNEMKAAEPAVVEAVTPSEPPAPSVPSEPAPQARRRHAKPEE
ncbi:hypothetical protein D3093_26885 (plasmid) [Azospirillum argentinense]|uniref:Uncharacterized protein n=1 Tax=Azospirillum argentinense TaxID=2970906 RepID=A0A4D8PK76_9PROT|nr:hypothetical protein [Azospirillum argentinense]QCN98913.1 hypothetical protein D3093_26885 [Azospirillum argentinense]